MQAYRSGHNEAVLKTVWVKARGGSNPSACAIKKDGFVPSFFYFAKALVFLPYVKQTIKRFYLFA